MNIKELKIQMIRKEKTAEMLYTALNISKSAWFRKISGQSEFTQSEIGKLISELDLDEKQTGIIFFNEKVS